jgi:hypothetical protein
MGSLIANDTLTLCGLLGEKTLDGVEVLGDRGNETVFPHKINCDGQASGCFDKAETVVTVIREFDHSDNGSEVKSDVDELRGQ